jgi:hypothetical protein
LVLTCSNVVSPYGSATDLTLQDVEELERLTHWYAQLRLDSVLLGAKLAALHKLSKMPPPTANTTQDDYSSRSKHTELEQAALLRKARELCNSAAKRQVCTLLVMLRRLLQAGCMRRGQRTHCPCACGTL